MTPEFAMLRAASAALKQGRRALHAINSTAAAVEEWGNKSSKMAGLQGALLTAGNPLLDISAVVTEDLLAKYGVSTWPWRMQSFKTPSPL